MFDSQCDIAALVYAPGDRPDLLLQVFACDLRGRGFHPAGIIQLDRRLPWEDTGVRLLTLPGGEIVVLRHVPGSRNTACRPEADQVAAVRGRVRTALARGADLLVVNRFGQSESEGGGFADEIRAASAAGVPVLVAVPQQRFPPWLRFCDGMSVKLDCSRAAVEAWWSTVAAAPRGRAPVPVPTYCELAK